MAQVAITDVAQVVIDEQNPWPGLGSFDESAERFFNGRTHETAELRRLVLQAPLTVLFGASGLGKTSLVQAGLFPVLRKEHILPVYVRLDVRDRNAPLLEQAKLTLQAQIRDRRIEAPAFSSAESLWQYLHRTGLELWSVRNQLLTPVFVFDQFEEVFTLGAENPDGIARLHIDLADLIENRMPASLVGTIRENEAEGAGVSLDNQRYKVLLSFREDFLPALEGWKRELPSILRNRLRLLPMSEKQAFEAVHTTASHLVDATVTWSIVQFVARSQEAGPDRIAQVLEKDAEVTVEPALLSLVCHGLNEKRKAQGKAVFDEALLTGTGQSIISDYYSNAVGDLPDGVQRFIENELITGHGFRKPCDVDEARNVYRITEEQLRLLVDRRLLRIEPRRGTEWVELTHDLLTGVVLGHRNRQRERERVRRQRRRMGILSAIGVLLLVLVATFGWSWRRATRERQKAEKASADAERDREKAEVATKTVKDINDALIIQKGVAEQAASDANTARGEAQRLATIATARRLSSDALRNFEASTANIEVSGALAVESLNTLPTLEGRQVLAQVLRLMPLAPQMIVKPHHGRIWSLAFSRDGHWMASGEQGTIILWDVANQMKKRVLEGPVAGPATFGLAFSYDGRWLAAGGMGELWIWETETGKLAQSIRISRGGYVRSLAFSPDGLHVAVALADFGVQLFQKAASQWEEVKSSASGEGTGTVRAVVFPTNDSLALAGKLGLSGNQYGVWFTNVNLGNVVPLPASNAQECRALALSQDSRVLAARCGNGIVTASRTEVDAGFPPSSDHHYQRLETSDFGGISLNPDGSYIAVPDTSGIHVVHTVWAPGTGNSTAEESTLMLLPSVAVAFRPDGKVLAAGLSDGSIALWPTTHGIESVRLQHEGVVTGLALSADEKWLATTSEDGVVRVFDALDLRKIRQSESFRIGPDVSSPVFSPDDRFLAVLDKKGLHLIQTKPWRRLTQYDVFGAFDVAAFSPDSRTVITVAEDGKIHRFDTATWQEKQPVITLIREQSRHMLQLSPDGRWLAIEEEIFARRHVTVPQRKVWNLATGKETAWSETGRPYAASSRPPQGGPQSLISDSEKWRTMNDKSLSPDGAWRANLNPYSSTVVLRDASTGDTVARLEHDGDLIDLAFSPGSRWLATASKDGSLRFWPLQAKDIIEQACKLLPRNLTPDEWKQLKIDGPFRKTCPNLP